MENNELISQLDDLPEPLLNARQVSLLLNISRSRTYALMQGGIIPCVHVGIKSRRVRREDLKKYILDNIYSES
jgi:excisionase family DNA binding protein